MDTGQESALKVNSGENSPATQNSGSEYREKTHTHREGERIERVDQSEKGRGQK